MVKLERYNGNPIIEPIPEHSFEASNTSNPGATIHNGKVHILYRAGSDQKRAGAAGESQGTADRLGHRVAGLPSGAVPSVRFVLDCSVVRAVTGASRSQGL